MRKDGRFCIVKDEDSHWYLIRADQRELFQRVCQTAYETEDFDAFVVTFDECRINGPHTLTFVDPKEDI